MEAIQALELHRVLHSVDLERPGDFAFIPKREPIRTIARTPVEPPAQFFKRILWRMFGPKESITETSEQVWPDYDAIVLLCPHCNQPIGTTQDHTILSLEPLTIQRPLACAYSRQSLKGLPTIAFQIQDGKIMPA